MNFHNTPQDSSTVITKPGEGVQPQQGPHQQSKPNTPQTTIYSLTWPCSGYMRTSLSPQTFQNLSPTNIRSFSGDDLFIFTLL